MKYYSSAGVSGWVKKYFANFVNTRATRQWFLEIAQGQGGMFLYQTLYDSVIGVSKINAICVDCMIITLHMHYL